MIAPLYLVSKLCPFDYFFLNVFVQFIFHVLHNSVTVWEIFMKLIGMRFRSSSFVPQTILVALCF